MTNFPCFDFPYSTGVKEIMKFFPSRPYGSNSPVLGITENSESESGEKNAVKGE